MTFDPYRVSEECVSEDELRELIEEWREGHDNLTEKEWMNQDYANGISAALDHCADELEELVE